MSLFHVVIYGIIQGLTEFLPVSSSGHLRIVQSRLDPHIKQDVFTAFTAMIQLGTTLALVLYFWRELAHIAIAWLRGLVDRSVRSSLEYRLGWYLIVSTAPVAVFGLVFSKQIEKDARNLWVIAVSLIALAVLLGIAEKVGKRTREEEDLNAVDAIVVGTAQALALIPGASRSGTTITAGLYRNLDRASAARFAFLMSIPAVVLSAVYEARKINTPGAPGVGLAGVGVLIAFIVGLAALAWLMRWISTHSTLVFIAYRIALGGLLLGLLATHTISPT